MNAENAAGDGWIEWEGGECPESAATMVVARMRNGGLREGVACNFYWHQSAFALPGDIVAYRVKLPTPADLNSLMGSLESASRWIRELVAQGDKFRTNERRLLDRLEALTADKQRLTDELIAARQAAAAVWRPVGNWPATPAPCSAQCDEEVPR